MRLPQPIADEFKPEKRIYELAFQRNIAVQFVNDELPNFIYWNQKKKKRRKDWDLAFWNWIKKGWEWNKEKYKIRQHKEFNGQVENKLPAQTNRDYLRKLRESVGI